MPAPRGLVQQIDQSLHRTQLLPRGARLLVAVSGGADTVALLRVLLTINGSNYWGWKLVVGHVDHGIRGAASAADARFVRRLAADEKLPFAERRLRLGKAASEDAAREARLRAFRAMARRHGCEAVVLAHHADDQAETVLMRMFRGTGIEGLAAMSVDTRIGNLRLLRPLLWIRRDALRDYLREVGQEWSEDETNATGQYLRNRVRGDLLPLAKSLWPQAVPALCRLAALAAMSHEVVATAARAIMHTATLHGRTTQVSRAALREAPWAVGSEVLRQMVLNAGGSTEQATFERLAEAMLMVRGTSGGKMIELGRNINISASGDRVTVSRRTIAKGRRGAR